jgi:hypothetical protein
MENYFDNIAYEFDTDFRKERAVIIANEIK